eukprot:1529356-Rhodomonas_salina.2
MVIERAIREKERGKEGEWEGDGEGEGEGEGEGQRVGEGGSKGVSEGGREGGREEGRERGREGGCALSGWTRRACSKSSSACPTSDRSCASKRHSHNAPDKTQRGVQRGDATETVGWEISRGVR